MISEFSKFKNLYFILTLLYHTRKTKYLNILCSTLPRIEWRQFQIKIVVASEHRNVLLAVTWFKVLIYICNIIFESIPSGSYYRLADNKLPIQMKEIEPSKVFSYKLVYENMCVDCGYTPKNMLYNALY